MYACILQVLRRCVDVHHGSHTSGPTESRDIRERQILNHRRERRPPTTYHNSRKVTAESATKDETSFFKPIPTSTSYPILSCPTLSHHLSRITSRTVLMYPRRPHLIILRPRHKPLTQALIHHKHHLSRHLRPQKTRFFHPILLPLGEILGCFE